MALIIVRGDLTKMKVDAIVNPSNRHLNPGIRTEVLTLRSTNSGVRHFVKNWKESEHARSVQPS